MSSNQQLRGPVPPSSNIVSEGFFIHFFLDARKAEVTNFELALVADEQVFWLDIAVNDAHGVQIGQSLDQLEDYGLDLLVLQSISRFLKHFQEVVSHVLKNEINHSPFAEGLLELDDVRVLQHLQYFHFPHCCFSHNFVIVSLFELLHRNDIVVSALATGRSLAFRSLAFIASAF